VQVLGNSEISFLETLGPERGRAAVTAVAAADVSCFVVTNGATPLAILAEAAEAAGVPVLVTERRTADFIRVATAWLEERLAPEVDLHGDLVDMHGLGIAILGKSGIGKSEWRSTSSGAAAGWSRTTSCACAASRRRCCAARPSISCATTWRSRGLGVIDVEAMFGTLATLDERQLDLVVELVDWEDAQQADRLGLAEDRHALLEVELPADPHPGAAGPEPRDADRDRGPEPPAPGARSSQRARVRGAARRGDLAPAAVAVGGRGGGGELLRS